MKKRTAIDVTNDPRWQALMEHNSNYTPTFVYAVKTTGIYALPGSASRLPNAANIEFFSSASEAEAAGYRPSKRARQHPSSITAKHRQLVTNACQALANTEAAPDLASLAEAAGLSQWYFHRVFKAATGVTPRAYAEQLRWKNMQTQLRGNASVTTAIYNAGFNSNSPAYQKAGEFLGMTPAAFRKGGHKQTIRFAVGETSLGHLLVAQSEKGICAILLGDDPHSLLEDLQKHFAKAELIGGDEAFEGTVALVAGMVEKPSTAVDLPLDIQGTAFQQRVWQALQKIPPGTTASYTDIAAMIEAPSAVRAVARACGANKLAIAIPCHRVVRHDGQLSGYRWGIARKAELLQREKIK
jgi:AraC family transcriptional regulator of adaptative response/methylated-DNA-[protein]-cysteine methyltransferase